VARSMTEVNFTRPELSPCLARLSGKDDARYQEALAILQAGKEALAQHPRPDMPGFQLDHQLEIEQQRKYDNLQQAAARWRAAILAGQKLLDIPAPPQ